ncbi:MAG: hypothetical protein HOC23_04495 [Halieaceae bacterium]|nr:hypothetical protein [Halieaceae bacterium]
MYETISLERDDTVATLTLNRPEKLNAYTVQMGEDIVQAFATIKNDDDVRAVIITGAGRSFCAGVDLDHLKEQQAGEVSPGMPKLGEEHFVQGFAEELFHFPKPVIAAINGAAVGVGVTMCLPCDMRIASSSAKLGLPFAKLGILPGLGSTYLLPRLVGLAKAKELVYRAQLIPAEKAAEIGLVDKVVADDELLNEAQLLASTISGYAPETMSAAKHALNFGAMATSLNEAVMNEHRESAALRDGRQTK